MDFDQFMEKVRKALGVPEGTSVAETLTRVTELNDRIGQLEEGDKARKTELDQIATEFRERLARRELINTQHEGQFRVSSDGRKILPVMSKEAAAALIRDARSVQSLREQLSGFNRDLNSGTAAEGGVLVTPEYSSELLGIITVYGDYRRYARVVPMSKKSQIYPALDGEGTDAQWVDEGGAPSANTNPDFGSVTLTNEILMALCPIPVSLLEDSDPAVAQLVAEFIARKFAKAEDLAGFKGTGAGIATQQPFTGILNDAGVNTVLLAAGTTFASATASDFLKMQDAVETAALDSAAYYVNRTILNHVRGLKDSNGRFIYQEPGGSQPATLWGYPVRTVEVLPKMSQTAVSTPFAIFGNLNYAMLGDRRAINIASSEHAMWANLKVLTRGFERVAVKVAVPDGIAVLTTNAA